MTQTPTITHPRAPGKQGRSRGIVEKAPLTNTPPRSELTTAGMTNKAAPPRKDRHRGLSLRSPPRSATSAESRNQDFFNNPDKGSFLNNHASPRGISPD